MTQKFINDLADKLQKVGALHAIGETWISIDSTIPAGGVPFLGQLVNRSVWADLFAWATAQGKVKTESEWQALAASHNGNVPFYSDGDGSTTFRMPKVVGYIKGAASQDEAGAYTPEGLPAHTHHLTLAQPSYVGNKGMPSGSFTISDVSSGIRKTLGVVEEGIYGNSDHVTPETHSILIGVYAVGVVANIGSADATQFLNGLAALEANTNAHIRVVEAWSSGTEWYRVWSDGWIEQGQTSVVITATTMTITFNKPFSNSSYQLLTEAQELGSSYYGDGVSVETKSATGFTCHGHRSNATGSNTANWYACGY